MQEDHKKHQCIHAWTNLQMLSDIQPHSAFPCYISEVATFCEPCVFIEINGRTIECCQQNNKVKYFLPTRLPMHLSLPEGAHTAFFLLIFFHQCAVQSDWKAVWPHFLIHHIGKDVFWAFWWHCSMYSCSWNTAGVTASSQCAQTRRQHIDVAKAESCLKQTNSHNS